MESLGLLTAALLVVSTSGCATLVTGDVQSIAISSNPPGALCDVQRNGNMLGQVLTPGVATVTKGNNALDITCRKPGYTSVVGTNESNISGWVLGNVLFGGIIGVGIDFATHADSVYGRKVTVTLQPAYANTPYGSASRPDFPPPSYSPPTEDTPVS